MTTLTVGKTLSELPPGPFVTLTKVQPQGALQARKQTSGVVSFFWRYSIGAKSERVPIGLYDSSAAPKSLAPTVRGYSFAAAVRAAEALAMEHHSHKAQGGRPGVLAARKSQQAAHEEAQRRAAQHTLAKLLDAYCNCVEALGRRSHTDARSIFKLHVLEPWPGIAGLPANEVTSEHFADMMRRLIRAGKGRTANKLRSYARSAYQMAKDARSKPSIPEDFKSFNISHNPVADTSADETANKPDKRPLSAPELRTYWRSIEKLQGLRGALLRLHLLTGAQRVEQLVNLKTENVSGDSILLFDGKGRPGRPARPHVVPLIEPAKEALLACGAEGKFALSVDGGKTHVSATTLSRWAADAAGTAIAGFQAKRIRSGVETLLAAARVPQEVRGRLQSHGIAGVQARHYDGHSYMEEKRAALETLFTRLTSSETSNVRALHAQRA
ncbi:integrase [Pseudacidovorax intermedius]|uniref:integrase n=1 Tax=Pseudacidovorax intermedius TaxID=433924 RepID=UPI0026ED475D|nr:integrase [Pseudacidovorax intermedius]